MQSRTGRSFSHPEVSPGAECFIAAGRQCVARSFALGSSAHFVRRGGGPRDLLGSTTLTDQVTQTYGRIVIITVHDVPCVCVAGRLSLFDEVLSLRGFKFLNAVKSVWCGYSVP